MPGYSKSLLSYQDIKQVLEQALDSNKGVRVIFDTPQAGTRFAMRASTFRLLDRKENIKLYPDPTHTLHGRSVFDALEFVRRECVVTVRRITLNGRVEEIE